jgi:hypothetical protein
MSMNFGEVVSENGDENQDLGMSEFIENTEFLHELNKGHDRA